MNELVLVIDDDSIVRDFMEWALRGAGYTVIGAADRVNGVAALRRVRPALVIIDIVMPWKDGMETIREIRALASEVPILAISDGGRIDKSDFPEIARRLGVSGILAKPFEAKELLATVASCLENSALHRP